MFQKRPIAAPTTTRFEGGITRKLKMLTRGHNLYAASCNGQKSSRHISAHCKERPGPYQIQGGCARCHSTASDRRDANNEGRVVDPSPDGLIKHPFDCRVPHIEPLLEHDALYRLSKRHRRRVVLTTSPSSSTFSFRWSLEAG